MTADRAAGSAGWVYLDPDDAREHPHYGVFGWALILLAFVGGVMSLAFMGLATAFMIIEKLPDIGRWISRPLGAALIAAAGWVALAGV